jgi:hypothetical protein
VRLAFCDERQCVLSLRSQSNSRRSNWEQLDQILDRAETLDHFLSSATLIDEYFQAFSSYFGRERFPRCSYDAVLEQLRTVRRDVPGFATKAWRKTPSNAPDFVVQTVGRSTGRDLDLGLWKLYRFQWLSQLKQKAGEGTSSRVWRREAHAHLSKLQTRIRAFEIELSRFGRREADALRSEFYKSCKADQKLHRIAAAILYQHLTASSNQHFFQLADADLVVHFLKELKQDPRRLLSGFSGLPVPGPLLSALKSLIPNQADLLADRKMFQLRSGYVPQCASYRTRTIRPFHGIWLGIAENDCLAGDPSALESVTPERWAVSLLQDSLTCILERNGAYQGFVRCVPLRDRKNRIFASFELWSPLMVSRVLLKSEGSSATKSELFFNQWFATFCDFLPSSWSGLIVSDSSLIDNSGVKRKLLVSEHWAQAVEMGKASELSHIDQSVDSLKRAVRPRGKAQRYCGEMVFDAKISDAEKVWSLSHPRFVEVSQQFDGVRSTGHHGEIGSFL